MENETRLMLLRYMASDDVINLSFQSYKLFVSVYDDRRDDENRFLRFVGNTRLINGDQTHGFRSPYRSRIWSARR